MKLTETKALVEVLEEAVVVEDTMAHRGLEAAVS